MFKIYHTSSDKIEKIHKNGLFNDCLFFSSEPYFVDGCGSGHYIYSLDAENLDFLDVERIQYNFNESDLEKLSDVISEIEIEAEWNSML